LNWDADLGTPPMTRERVYGVWSIERSLSRCRQKRLEQSLLPKEENTKTKQNKKKRRKSNKKEKKRKKKQIKKQTKKKKKKYEPMPGDPP